MILNQVLRNVVINYAGCQYVDVLHGSALLFIGFVQHWARSFWIDHYSNQRVCRTVRMFVRKGQLPFAFIEDLCALRVSAKIKRLILFAGDTTICIVRFPNQFYYLFQCHADLQFVEFAAWGGVADDLPFDQPVGRFYRPYVCICPRRSGFSN